LICSYCISTYWWCGIPSLLLQD